MIIPTLYADMEEGAVPVVSAAVNCAAPANANATAFKPDRDPATEKANQLQTSPSASAAADNSSKPQRKRNKPSLSCETCTVSGPMCFRQPEL